MSRRRGRERRPRPVYRARKFGLDEESDRRLTAAARAHGVSRSAYVRALLNGHRPGAEPGTEVALADAWWDSRSAKRRVSIWRNHATMPAATAAADEDQLTIFDADSREAFVETINSAASDDAQTARDR